MKRPRASAEILANVALATLLFGVFVLCLTASTDGDIYWHLAAGREMTKRDALLAVDEFSVSARGRPWVDVHWLFQLLCAWGHQLGGLRALVLGKALIVSGGALLLARVVRRQAGAAAVPLFALGFLAALLAVRDLLLLRPTIFTLLFIAAFVHVIERALKRGQPRLLWLLPLLQVAWVNVQGLFALGPGIVFAYWLGTTLQRRLAQVRWFPFVADPAQRSDGTLGRGLLLALGATCAACLVNPFGLRAVALPSELLRRLTPGDTNAFSSNIAENVPPFVLEQQTGQFWHLKWFLLGLALALVAAGPRLRLRHCFLVGGFLVLGLIANRNVLLLYWVATPFAAGYLSLGLRRLLLGVRRAQLTSQLVTGTGAIGLVVVAANLFWHEPSIAAPAPFRVPALSAQWLAAQAGTSRIFAADHYGGYLIWKLFPKHVPYLDTRLILRNEQQFAEYLGVIDDPGRFDAFAERFGFDYVVLPTAYPDRYLGLLRHLFENPSWRLVLSDGSETLFARRERSPGRSVDLALASTTDELLADFERRYPEPRVRADARWQLATLQLALGHAEEAEHALQASDDVPALALRARARLAQGDAPTARRIALGALGADPNHVRSLNLLAVISLEEGEVGKAMGYLRRAVHANPFDSETRAILHSLEEKPHDAIN